MSQLDVLEILAARRSWMTRHDIAQLLETNLHPTTLSWNLGKLWRQGFIERRRLKVSKGGFQYQYHILTGNTKPNAHLAASHAHSRFCSATSLIECSCVCYVYAYSSKEKREKREAKMRIDETFMRMDGVHLG